MGPEGQAGRFDIRLPEPDAFGQAQRRLNPFWAHPTAKTDTKKPLDDPPEY
jgi:hypothetical protein